MTLVPTEKSRAPAALWIAGLVSILGGLWLMLWFWRGGMAYDATSGVWTALADDLAHGDFYRPVASPLGYGGTRYMPLFFSLHAGLIRAGLSPAAAGFFLTVVSIAVLSVGARLLMRSFGAHSAFALTTLCLLPASIGFQLLTASVKGDLLAAAFSVWGLVMAKQWIEKPDARTGWLTAALFAAALLTKFTAGFALAATLLWLFRRRQFSIAAHLLVSTVGLVVVALTLVYGLSAGRIAESFRVCATGGLNAGYAWKFPLWFAWVAAQDPFFTVIFIAGISAAVRRVRRGGLDLLGCYFAVTAIATVLIFASPGTDSNHLIDLLVASAVMLAVELTQGGSGRPIPAVAWTFAAAIVITWLPGVPSVRHFFIAKGRPTLAAVNEIARRLPQGGTQRLLSENPLVPVALGQRPEVMDAFSLRLLAARAPKVREKFLADLQNQNYTAVILMDWSGSTESELPAALANHTSLGVRYFYGEVHFPAGFMEILRANYRLSFAVAPFVIFEPLTRAALPAAAVPVPRS